LYASFLSFLFSLFIELRDFLREGLGHRILLAAITLEPNEREETIGLAVFGFAICEAWESPEPPPVRRARIGIVATGKRLCGESSDELWKRSGVLQPGLEVAGACLNDGARIETFRREPRERGLVEVVKYGETVLPEGRI
jgi:hypothetical protein